jgi:hypothetical protein
MWASAYGFLQGAWPFGIIEAIWVIVALRRWRVRRRSHQLLHAPHIAEAEDAAMARMEAQMAAAAGTVRKALNDLKGLIGATASAQLTAAIAAFDRFEETNREILALSRRNSEVRSLALSLGRKRMVTAVADDQLRGLEEALAKHAFTGTR